MLQLTTPKGSQVAGWWWTCWREEMSLFSGSWYSESSWTQRAIVIPGRLCQSAPLSWWLAPGVLCCPSCAAPPPLAWDYSSPGTGDLTLFPKPFCCRHTELFSSWQHLGPRCTCNCVIPCAGIRISGCASRCPQSAFSFLRGIAIVAMS